MKVKDITLEEAKDIANRYAHCEDRFHHCVKVCTKCKYDYTGNEIRRVMQFVLKLEKEQKE